MRVGIFAGTFDPVHNGHIAFAQAAREKAGLDKVLFLPEPQPRYKQNVTNISAREAMLRLVCLEYEWLDLLILDDKVFSISLTLPKIQQIIKGDLFFLLGGDVANSMHTWPQYKKLASRVTFIIGVRQGIVPSDIPQALYISADHGAVTSTKIRNGDAVQLPTAVATYIALHKLYNR